MPGAVRPRTSVRFSEPVVADVLSISGNIVPGTSDNSRCKFDGARRKSSDAKAEAALPPPPPPLSSDRKFVSEACAHGAHVRADPFVGNGCGASRAPPPPPPPPPPSRRQPAPPLQQPASRPSLSALSVHDDPRVSVSPRTPAGPHNESPRSVQCRSTAPFPLQGGVEHDDQSIVLSNPAGVTKRTLQPRLHWDCEILLLPREVAMTADLDPLASTGSMNSCDGPCFSSYPGPSSPYTTGASTTSSPLTAAPHHVLSSSSTGPKPLAPPIPEVAPAAAAAFPVALNFASLRRKSRLVTSGVLRLHSLPAPPSVGGDIEETPKSLLALRVLAEDCGSNGGTSERPATAVADPSSALFCCTCPPGTQVFVASDGFIFPIAEDLLADATFGTPAARRPSADEAGCSALLFLVEPALVSSIAARMIKDGCQVRWRPTEEALLAAEGLQAVGDGIAGAIRGAGDLLGRGVKHIGGQSIRGLTTEPIEMSQETLQVASSLRHATMAAAKTTGVMVGCLAETIGWAGAAVARQLPDRTEQWQADVGVVAKSTVNASVSVWSSINDATARFWGDVADTSAAVVEKKYGGSAGTATRDSLHAVGNAVEVAAYVRGAAPILAGKSAESGMQNLEGGYAFSSTTQTRREQAASVANVSSAGSLGGYSDTVSF
eukprot:TRINITY_DN70450_c0_g1_i1.p1 TRINITY_DN70450_c0_g1~~TRINITY_DN70450_c0_g1_i1.p1  ORF type:complete len:661 (-),score=105.62 TRINITY_DN70450_c0_g1_i1:54-2036(-)